MWPSQTQVFTRMLHMIPLTVVETRKEVDDVKDHELSVICRSHTQVFTRMLHMIPLTVVESRKEVDDVKELVSICRNYHIALRCELKRKVRAVVQQQLCCELKRNGK